VAIVDVIVADPKAGSALAKSLKSSGWQIQRHTDINTVLSAAVSEQPRCLVVTVEPTGGVTAEDVQRLLAEQEAPVVVLQSDAGVDKVVEFMRAGATEVITDPKDRSRIVRRVRQVVVDDAEAARIRLAKARVSERYATLTPREKEAMGHVVTGKANKQIASEMNVSIKTLEVHRARVMRKMHADSLAQLVRQSIMMEVDGRRRHFEPAE